MESRAIQIKKQGFHKISKEYLLIIGLIKKDEREPSFEINDVYLYNIVCVYRKFKTFIL